MAIHGAARTSGLSIDAIRFYETAGKRPRPPRDARRRRVFDAGSLDGPCILERLRATTMPLAEMRRFAAPSQEGGEVAERLALLRDHRGGQERRPAEIDACAAFLDRKIDVYAQAAAE